MQNLFISSSSPVSGQNNLTDSQLTALTIFYSDPSNLASLINQLEPGVEAIIQKVQALIIEQTQKPLNHLQESILRGTIQGHTYAQIAEANYVSESHIKNISAKLWEFLSKKLGKDVNKTNFRSLFETINTDKLLSICQDHQVIINCLICPLLNRSETCVPSSQQTKSDLKNAPALIPLYGRTQELEILQQAITSNTRLITIFGLVGMGKTTLIRNFIDNIHNQFDYIFWHTLPNAPNFTDFQTRFNNLLSPEKNDTPLIDYCQNYRCLIILDNYHNLFTPTELAGKYLPETENWQQFLQQITTLSHQSCLIIISQELPREIDDMTDDYTHIKIVELNGLDRDTTSQMFGKISAFIDFSLYQGHPAYAKSMALMQKKLGQNNMEILAKKAPIFPQDLQLGFDQAFHRLSAMEKQIIFILARENYATNVAKLKKINISPTELANALQSLMRRSWVIQDDDGLILSAIVRIYISCRCYEVH